MQTALSPAMDLDTRILIVDDDDGISSLMASFLEKHGFVCATADNPVTMREMLARERYDLIVLDVMMPREDGLTALRKLVAEGGPRVIMLSAVGTDIDRVVGLEMGADDYLPKPCNPRELLARIRTVLRRNTRETESATSPVSEDDAPIRARSLHFDGWRMNLDAHIVMDPTGSLVPLSTGEFRLLRAFAQHPQRVLTRDQLLDYAHDGQVDTFDRAIDVQISRLRRKLNRDDLIRTVRSEGYIFTPTVSKT